MLTVDIDARLERRRILFLARWLFGFTATRTRSAMAKVQILLDRGVLLGLVILLGLSVKSY